MKTMNNKKNPYYHEPGWLPDEYRNLTGKSVLVLNDAFTAMKLARKNNVRFVTADERAARNYERCIVNNHVYGMDDSVVLIDKWSLDAVKTVLYKYMKENKMEKFDIIIMNPPYDGDLHLKVLEAVIPHADRVVDISPISRIVNCVNTFNGKVKFQDTVYKHLYKCHDEIPEAEKFALFAPTRIVPPLAIQEYRYDVDSLDEFERVNSHGGMKYIAERVYKYARAVDNLANHLERDRKDGYRVKFTRLSGGTQLTPHVFRFFKQIVVDGLLEDGRPHWQMNSANQCTKKTDTMGESLPFATRAEAQNFIGSYKTTFMKCVVGLLQPDINVHPNYMPYMGDYTKPWTNADFCRTFAVTGYIDDTTAEPGSEWATILGFANGTVR